MSKLSDVGPFSMGDRFATIVGSTIRSLHVGPQFWETVGDEAAGGLLISQMRTDAAWSQWEMHPLGEEMIYQLTGEMELILEEEGSERNIRLPAGQFVIVPRGIWHTANCVEAGDALYITWGEGTQNRAR
jgi:mannose-6-phosphate isomerase-like protein (cupin superfamily)